jgi:hypothetical protein
MTRSFRGWKDGGMQGKRGGLLAVLVVLFAAIAVLPAHACSCASGGDPRERLAAADGAFIGALVSRRETGPLGSVISTGRDVIYTFEVAEAFKGDIGRRVEVHSAASGVSCGFEVPPGEPTGVLLDGDNGTWRSGLCGQIKPEELRTAAAPLPAPDGQPPAALVVGGGFGEARLLALDRHARTLGYGYGAGDTTQLSVCPDGNRILELVRDHPKPSRLALRELPDLRLVWERPLPRQPPSVYVDAVRCLGGDGSAYVFASNGGDPRWSPRATLLRVSPTTTIVLYRGTARSIAFGPEVAYLNEGRWGERIGRIDLRSGQVTPVLTGPRYMTRLALRPDGVAVATQVWGDDLVRPGQNTRNTRPAQAVVVDLHSSPPRVCTTTLGSADQAETGRPVWGTMVWLTFDRVGFFPADHAVPRATIFDTSLRRLGGIDQWAAATTIVVGDGIVGLGQGKLTVAELPNGPARVLQQFQSPQTFALAALPEATLLVPRAHAVQAPAPPGATPAPRAAEPETHKAAALPIPVLAASTTMLALLTGLFLFSRARRRRTRDA